MSICAAIIICAPMEKERLKTFQTSLIMTCGQDLHQSSLIKDYPTNAGGELGWNTAMASWVICVSICLMPYAGCWILNGQNVYNLKEASMFKKEAIPILQTAKRLFSNTRISTVYGTIAHGEHHLIPIIHGRISFTGKKES